MHIQETYTMLASNGSSAISRKLHSAGSILKQLTALVYDPRYATSYYPNDQHKSKLTILKENLAWWIKHKEVNKFYYVYGLDTKDGRTTKEILPYRAFRAIRDRKNLHVKDANFNYVCLLRDKFIFGQFLVSLGIPTPKNVALIDNESVTWLDTQKKIPIEDIATDAGGVIDGFCKQLTGLCGEGAFPLILEHGKIISRNQVITPADLRNKIQGKYLLQERLTQHPALSKLHPQSVNTLRIITFNNNGRVELFSATLRIGSGNKSVDNWASGGIIVGINTDTGKLREYGLFKPGFGGRVEEHPDTHVSFKDFEIPFFKQSVEQSCRLHGFLYGIHSVGWDVAITKDGPVFIEGNDDWDGSIPMSIENNFRTRFLNMFYRQK